MKNCWKADFVEVLSFPDNFLCKYKYAEYIHLQSFLFNAAIFIVVNFNLF